MMFGRVVKLPIVVGLLALTLVTAGCGGTSWDVTRPPRSAMEQRLISTAADRSAKRLTTLLTGELGTVYLDVSLLEGYDKTYAIQAVRREMLTAGITLADKPETADTIVEISSGALSIDYSKFLLGVPSLSFPLPLIGQISLPEIALVGEENHMGISKLSLSARNRKSGQAVAEAGIRLGSAYNDNWTILMIIGFNYTNLPEPPEEEEPEDD